MNNKIKMTLKGALFGLFIGILFSTLFISGTIDDVSILKPLFYLTYLDLIGISLLLTIFKNSGEYGPLIYIITTPISLTIWGSIIGLISTKFKKTTNEKYQNIINPLITATGFMSIGYYILTKFFLKFLEHNFNSSIHILIFLFIIGFFPGLIINWNLKPLVKIPYIGTYFIITTILFLIPIPMILTLPLLYITLNHIHKNKTQLK